MSTDAGGFGFPSWVEPWTWVDYYVFPETLWLGTAGLVLASVYLLLVFTGRRLLAFVALLTSLALLSYPFFGGLTTEGHPLFSFGPLLGVLGLVVGDRRGPATS